MPYAAIDLGTNTFHLLIVEIEADGFKEIFRQREHVFLAEEGIKTIGTAAYTRGIKTLKAFKQALDKYDVKDIAINGTAALRTATNGPAFVKEVKNDTGIEIRMISGLEEANLIYHGVKQALPIKQPTLIMDIGGGSVEFIIADDEKLLWAQSFPIGVAVMYKSFHNSDPISKIELTKMNIFLENMLQPLFTIMEKYKPEILIGASGTFDVLADILTIEQEYQHGKFVAINDFSTLYKKIINSNYEERINMSIIPSNRKKLIVVALILVEFIFNNFEIKKLGISAFAMKEGMIAKAM